MELETTTLFLKHDDYSQARRHPRVPTAFPVFVRDDAFRLSDQARDLSEVGIGVETDRPLPPMTLVTLHLEVPHAPEPVDVLGRVMWSNRRAMGIRFEHTSAALVDAVDRLRREFQAI